MLSLDPGTSMTKMVYCLPSEIPSKAEMLCMESELIKISKDSLDLYESGQMSRPNPENEAWIEYKEEYYAVGFLAQKYFEARINFLELKYENAIPKTLAAVGAIAMREGLNSHLDLSLGLLLPYGEWEDRERLEMGLKKALSNFSFRGKEFCVNLISFQCLPEGGGLVLTRSKKLGTDFNKMNIAVVMLGFRDISAVIFTRGISTGKTEGLGLAWMLERIKSRTSGQNLNDLLKAVHLSGSALKPRFFNTLARSKNAEFKAAEVAQIIEVAELSRKEYWNKVSIWLSVNIPVDIQQVIIGGGTSEYLATELKNLFTYTEISWAAELEEDVRLAFNLPPKKDAMCLRFTDVYGLFRYQKTTSTMSSHRAS
ncbi:ParM/StbA family protein [Nostoc sp. UHCC 0870]|uniref:ParM/StbA family protein n=2 Tax=Nostoc sp. UHCC 0870 TaxID=2914041 RepID=UPI001EDFAE8A|nr:ParM/StbA family protein [Nostoc sp. UHCC 0870]UKP01134.1 ParM/StbA family protein [Nostoc sp. UHCC 0870]UKP01206.1 ParM/StbA family protein [Nostoc sp. UHCC 0870]